MRDLRDPQKLGESILHNAQAIRADSGSSEVFFLSETYSDGDWKMIPDYDHGESLVTDTVRQYRIELKRAAEAGDKHARDTLRGIPNDDPSGD